MPRAKAISRGRASCCTSYPKRPSFSRPMSPQPSLSPRSSAATAVRRCSSSRPSYAGNRFVPHRHSDSHDQTLLLSRCVGSSSTSTDSARLCPYAARACLLLRCISEKSAIAAPPLHIASTSSTFRSLNFHVRLDCKQSNPHSRLACPGCAGASRGFLP